MLRLSILFKKFLSVKLIHSIITGGSVIFVLNLLLKMSVVLVTPANNGDAGRCSLVKDGAVGNIKAGRFSLSSVYRNVPAFLIGPMD